MTSRSLLAVLFAALLTAPLAHAEEAPLRAPPDRPIDVTRIALDLTVDLEARSVAGTATLELTALRPLRHVSLDAVDHEVAEVVALRAGDVAPLEHAYDGSRLVVDLGREVPRGEGVRLRVRYRVREPKAGLHFFGPSAEEPDVPYQVWSQGESTYNRYWFPCVDHPDERQATALTARVKPGLTVISNGDLRGVEDDPETGLSVWRFDQERGHVAYLVTLVVGTFRKVSDTWRGKPLGYYVPPRYSEEDVARSFGNTKRMLDLFSDLTGVDYPWPKYDQVVVEQFIVGGMENTGATTLNERTLHDARAHLDYRSEGLVAHELAHQWYGDLLTCRDWSHIWLNESFATYFDALWTEHDEGPDAYAHEMLGNADRGLPAGRKRPILDWRYADPGSMFDGRAYPKGSCVLHMLRRQLGEEAFWRGVRDYTAQHADQGVETDDLRRALERASGRSLKRFFHDFVERAGHPQLKVSLARDAERGLLTVTIEQTQQGEPYSFPAELRFRFGEAVETHVVDVSERRHRFVLPRAAAPSAFRFDPREAVLLKEVEVHKGRDLWLAQLREDDGFGRLRAARALAKDRAPQAVDALLQALAEDAFWGVRAEAARALGGAEGERVRDALLARLKAEPEARARRAVVEALGSRGRDADVAVALQTLLKAGDPSYYVEAAAVQAYAATAEAPRALLEAQLDKPSHNEVICLAAIRGLRRLEDAALVPVFVGLLGKQHPPAVRREAAGALSVAGLPGTPAAVQKEAVDALVGLLRASRRGGERAALRALGALKGAAATALSAVEQLARLDPEHRVRTDAERAAEAIRSGQAPDGQLTDLRQETAALRDRLRALEEAKEGLEARLDRLELEQAAGEEGGKR